MTINIEDHGEMIRGHGAVEVEGVVHAMASDYSSGELPPDNVTVCGAHNFGDDISIGAPVLEFRDEGYSWCEDCWSVAPIPENV